MTDNPYSSPRIDERIGQQPLAVLPTGPVFALAKPGFIAWAQLRIVYIVLLGMFTIILAVSRVFTIGPKLFTIRGLGMIAVGTVVVNVCYFAGPIVETHVRWLGYK